MLSGTDLWTHNLGLQEQQFNIKVKDMNSESDCQNLDPSSIIYQLGGSGQIP